MVVDPVRILVLVLQTILTPEAIRVVTCEGTAIYLGNQNKLASVSYGGGDAGGGNVTVSY